MGTAREWSKKTDTITECDRGPYRYYTLNGKHAFETLNGAVAATTTRNVIFEGWRRRDIWNHGDLELFSKLYA